MSLAWCRSPDRRCRLRHATATAAATAAAAAVAATTTFLLLLPPPTTALKVIFSNAIPEYPSPGPQYTLALPPPGGAVPPGARPLADADESVDVTLTTPTGQRMRCGVPVERPPGAESPAAAARRKRVAAGGGLFDGIDKLLSVYDGLCFLRVRWRGRRGCACRGRVRGRRWDWGEAVPWAGGLGLRRNALLVVMSGWRWLAGACRHQVYCGASLTTGVLYVLFVLCSAVACYPTRSRVPPSPTMTYLLSFSICTTQLEGWWTYEFCYGSRLVQRHIPRDGEDDTTYVLGLAPPSLARFGDQTSATAAGEKPDGDESSTEGDGGVAASSTSPGSAGMVVGVWILRHAVALLLCGVCPWFTVSVAAAPTVSW